MSSEEERKENSFSESEVGMENLSRTLNLAKSRIGKLTEKKGSIFCEWIDKKTDYILKEIDFTPKSLRAYSRGEIILVELGYNVGSEYGGIHYVLVLRDSTKTNPLLSVVPLTSLKENQYEIDDTEDDIKKKIHRESLYIGHIEGLPEKKSVAIVNQVITISKIRVIDPKSAKQKVSKVSVDVLDELDKKIIELYTH